jgi:pyruvate dehydrogenase E1 component alpha subunit
MAEIRAFEEALGDLWQRGLISGELHLGIGEEGAIVGVVDHLRDGDSMATDHRSTPPFVARGTDLRALTLEMLGHSDGLCSGCGGHMHLFDCDRLSASSGIVGAAAPTACGFALAHQQSASENVAVAFFGEGAANQGMLLEALNLASVWRLPVVFVCKDSRWAITTRSARMTGGSLTRRARGFGLPAVAVDGRRPWAVWKAAGRAIDRARRGRGPSFVVVRVKRPRGHFEDDPLVRMSHHPREILEETRELLTGVTDQRGGLPRERVLGLLEVTRTLTTMISEQLAPSHDPLLVAARRVGRTTADSIRSEAEQKVDAAVSAALEVAGVFP